MYIEQDDIMYSIKWPINIKFLVSSVKVGHPHPFTLTLKGRFTQNSSGPQTIGNAELGAICSVSKILKAMTNA